MVGESYWYHYEKTMRPNIHQSNNVYGENNKSS